MTLFFIWGRYKRHCNSRFLLNNCISCILWIFKIIFLQCILRHKLRCLYAIIQVNLVDYPSQFPFLYFPKPKCQSGICPPGWHFGFCAVLSKLVYLCHRSISIRFVTEYRKSFVRAFLCLAYFTIRIPIANFTQQNFFVLDG